MKKIKLVMEILASAVTTISPDLLLCGLDRILYAHSHQTLSLTISLAYLWKITTSYNVTFQMILQQQHLHKGADSDKDEAEESRNSSG